MQDEMNDIQMPYTDSAPQDLVRVIRCKNCKYYQDNWAPRHSVITHYCEMNDTFKKPEGYCDEGDRRDV